MPIDFIRMKIKKVKKKAIVKFVKKRADRIILLLMFVYAAGQSVVAIANGLSMHRQTTNALSQADAARANDLSDVFQILRSKHVAKVFSFPGDPIFYVLFDQKPPYWLTAYESSPRYAQEDNIAYLQRNHVTTVIYNTRQQAIQDQVPNYARVPIELSYILSHYAPTMVIDGYYILEQKEHNNLLENIKADPDFYRPLLSVDLEAIPLSEGRYKATGLQKATVLLRAHDKQTVARFLKSADLYSANIVLLIKTPKRGSQMAGVVIGSTDGITTHVRFKSCTEFPCVIHLARLPLFYQNNKITAINIDQATELTILRLSGDSELW